MLYTFGYEGLAIDQYITRLQQVGVKTIVDVRQLPLSRKRGFSKRSFSEALEKSGIAYLHSPTLGCPKVTPIRLAAIGTSTQLHLWRICVHRTRPFANSQRFHAQPMPALFALRQISTSAIEHLLRAPLTSTGHRQLRTLQRKQ